MDNDKGRGNGAEGRRWKGNLQCNVGAVTVVWFEITPGAPGKVRLRNLLKNNKNTNIK